MKVLFVVPYVPSLVRVRPFNMIRALSARGHKVTLLTLWTSERERQELDKLRTHCQAIFALPIPLWRSLINCAQVLPGKEPLQSVYSWRQDLVAPFVDTQDFDVVHVEHLRGSRYGLFLKTHTDIPVVWDSVDSITHLFRQAASQSTDLLRRWRSKFELGRTERYEGWLVNQFDHVLVTSATDKQALLSLNTDEGSPPISVVPNGVDLDYFQNDAAIPREPATLLISGKMSYHANIAMTMHMVQNILPVVWQERPDVKLLIVGKDPTREIQALAQNSKITVTGTVEHLPPYLQRATMAVAPITYNAGIQNKVLEAMACGTPVITSPQAVANLPLQPGRHVLVAEDTVSFARQILSLLSEPSWRRQLGQAGREYVEEHHNWAKVAAQLEGIYTAVQAKKRSPQTATSPSPLPLPTD